MNSGTMRWTVTAIYVMFARPGLMEKQLLASDAVSLFDGLVMSCGAEVAYKPINQTDEAANTPPEYQHASWKINVILLECGWTGHLLVADWDDIENCELISDSHTKRCKSKEVIVIKEDDIVSHVLTVP